VSEAPTREPRQVSSGGRTKSASVRAPQAARVALAVAVGLVLADSSVVVLALPEIYRELDVSVSAVVWVLIAFNLVLAASAVPAAHLAATVGPARLTVAGLGLFAAASLGCGLAPGIEVLIGARCVQAVGGAAAVCAALELMPALYGSERGAVRAWAAAGAAGAALGPGLGGLLTELISWQSIFLFQVPAALAVAVPLLGVAASERPGRRVAVPAGRPHLAANAALALVSAALAAALFLVVLLLIEGWRLTPIAAAAAVTVLPASALLAAPLTRRVPEVDARAAAGVVLIAGGLAGLALLPRASVLLTFPPQALVGIGLALTLSALTEAALAGRSAQAIHGGWTIAARHAGVVAGLLVLTPVFTGDLEREREHAEQAGTAVLLDARLPPAAKLELADRISERIDEEGDKVPVLAPAFEPLPEDPAERAETVSLRAAITDQVDRAATHAFSASFLIATGFALAALAPIAIARRRIEL
jgi:MFS family permease